MKVLKIANDFKKMIWGLITEDDLDEDLQDKVNSSGFTLPIDKTYSGDDGTSAINLQITSETNTTPDYITLLNMLINGGDGTYGNIGLQISGLSGGDSHFPIIIKASEPVTNTVQVNNTLNYLSLIDSILHLGGMYQSGHYASVVGGIQFNLFENEFRMYDYSNDKYLNIKLNDNSTHNLNLDIENTKATLEKGDMIIFDNIINRFKIDNISNYIKDKGNYHVLKVEFAPNVDFETTTILPVGSQIDKIVIHKASGLTNGTQPLVFKINGTTEVVLATQGAEFDNTSNPQTYDFIKEGIDITLSNGEEGTFMAEWSGAGFGTGTGYAYLFYWTPLL